MLLPGVLDLLPGLEAAESGLDLGGGLLLQALLLPHQVAADAGLDLGRAAVLDGVVLVLVLLVHCRRSLLLVLLLLQASVCAPASVRSGVWSGLMLSSPSS